MNHPRAATQGLLCAASLLLSAAWLSAAPLIQDLGGGLSYIRIAHTPADLPGKEKAVEELSARIIDLRGTAGDGLGIQTLIAWLQFRARPEIPTLVLVNRQTAASLSRYVISNQLPAQLSFSASACRLETDILVDTTLESDATAIEEIDNGSAVASLISAKVEKTRMDEAVLSRDHGNGLSRRETEAVASDKPAQVSREIDPVLARAVQVHQAMKALKARG